MRRSQRSKLKFTLLNLREVTAESFEKSTDSEYEFLCNFVVLHTKCNKI